MNINEQVDDLIKKMTLEEKASLCSGEGYWHTKGVERLGIGRIMLTDGPHGLRRQEGNADHLGLNKSVQSTCFPAGATAANSWDGNLIREMGRYIAAEAKSEGVGVVLGPAINIKRNPLCGRNFEYYSEDPYLSGKLAVSYIEGVQSMGVAACPKHFAVNNQERLRMVIDSVVDERTLREIYLLPFEYAVREGRARTIMSAYNKINGTYANENMHVLDEILHGEWGFDGVVISDWGASNDRVEALKAGSHLEMPTTMGETDREIVEAVKEGRIDEELLDRRVRPLLRLILEAGNNLAPGAAYSKGEHHRFAREIAEKSMVLLKNDDSILPINDGRTVAVIGDFAADPRYQGAGSSIINPTRLDSPLAALKDSGLNIIGFEKGFNRFGRRSSLKKRRAVELAGKADTVLLFLGLDESTEAEGLDRRDMKLTANQTDLIEAVCGVNGNIVVILSGGSPVETHWDRYAKALLHGYLGGQAGAGAIASILTGRINPSGKLAETYAERYEELSSAAYFPGGDKTTEYREGIYVGYRYFDKAGIEPKYPFGFGLSYTSFEYSDLTAGPDRVELSLTNRGDRAGEEICQIYIRPRDSRVFRAEKELKGFAKVRLEPGETKRVAIELDDRAFAYYNTARSGWVVDRGEYDVCAAASSRDIRLTAVLSIEGEEPEDPYGGLDLLSYETGKVDAVGADEFSRLLGRPLPEPDWSPDDEITENSSILEGALHRGAGRFIYGFLKAARFFVRGNIKHRTAIEVSFFMPYRSLARMTNGLMDMPMLMGILTMVNKNFITGFRQFLRAWKRRKQYGKAFEREGKWER